MTDHEAREILLLYRPGQEDQDDDRLQQALELAAHDPELAAWFEQHRALQKAVRACLQQIQVPEGLKEQILSERKAYFAKTTRRRAAVAVASLVVIAAAFFAIIRQNASGPASDDSFANFRARMAGDVQRLYPAMDLETNRLDVIRDYLAHNQGHAQAMLPAGLERYFSEIARVLKRGGRAFMTFYLLNDESLRAIEAGKVPEQFRFKHPLGSCRVTYKDAPEYAVAHIEEFVIQALEKSGVRLEGPVHYGRWCGRAEFLSWQDVIVAETPQ